MVRGEVPQPQLQPQAADTVWGRAGTIAATHQAVDGGIRLHTGMYVHAVEQKPAIHPPIDVAFVGSGETLPPVLQLRAQTFEKHPERAARWLVKVELPTDENRLSLTTMLPSFRRQALTDIANHTEDIAVEVIRKGMIARARHEQRTAIAALLAGTVGAFAMMGGALMMTESLQEASQADALGSQALKYLPVLLGLTAFGLVIRIRKIYAKNHDHEALTQAADKKLQTVMESVREAIVPPRPGSLRTAKHWPTNPS